MNTLTEAVANLERLWPPYPEDGNHSVAPTGEPYVAMSIRGDGVSEDVVIAAWHQAVLCYGSNVGAFGITYRRGKLYWRERPAVEVEGDRIGIYGRLLISDLPPTKYPTKLPPR